MDFVLDILQTHGVLSTEVIHKGCDCHIQTFPFLVAWNLKQCKTDIFGLSQSVQKRALLERAEWAPVLSALVYSPHSIPIVLIQCQTVTVSYVVLL